MNSIRDWLHAVGLGQFAEIFEREQIDMDSLVMLTESNLRDLGLPMGPRAKLLTAIQALKATGGIESTADSTSPAAVSAAPSISGGDRRQLSVMFCDLVGSTELSRRLDPEVLRAHIRRYQDLCVGAISRFEGYVAQYLGDGVLAYFGYPVALEAGAERAIRAALAILDRVAEADTGERPLQVRIGIDTGLVVIGHGSAKDEKDRTAIGDAPNVAARLQGLATPGQVVVSERTRVLAVDAFLYRDMGSHALKGLDQPLRVWQVEGTRTAESRFAIHSNLSAAPMVGREVEFEAALQAWRRVKAGKGQILLLSGEPGIGKSRILHALRERLSQDNTPTWQYQCSPHFVNSALYPIIENFERTLKFRRNETPEEKLDRLENQLIGQHGLPMQSVNLIARLLNLPADARYGPLAMTAQKQKDETLKALVDVIAAAARRSPLLLVFEDLHWADPTTLEGLEILLGRVGQIPALILMSYRPEFRAPWLGQASVTALTLSRLDPEQIVAVATRVAGAKPLPDEIVQHIIAKTDGVPLFVEELTKAILESKLLAEETDRHRLTGPMTTMAIPSTLRDSLMARLDRLASVKDLAQMGACIGREFSHELLALISPLGKTQLQDALDKLVQSELVLRRGSGAQTVYLFKHALIQDASYDSLLKSRRVELHLKIAQTLEQHFPETKSQDPEILAHHYTEASDAERAVEYWAAAGHASFARAAITETLRQARCGMDQIAALPHGARHDRRELDFQVLMGNAYIQSKGLASIEADVAFRRAYELRGVVDNSTELMAILWGIFVVRLIGGQPSAALEIAREIMSKAKGEHAAELVARLAMMDSYFWLGEFATAQQYSDQVIAQYDDDADPKLMALFAFDIKITVLIYTAHVQWMMGFPERAIATKRQVDAWARHLDHPFMYAFAYTWGSGPFHYTGDLDAHWEQVEKGYQVSHQIGFPHFEGQAELWTAWNRAQRGDLSRENLDRFEQSITHFAGTGSGILVPYFRTLYAQALAQSGHVDAAHEMIRRALELVDDFGEVSHAAEIHRIRAEVLCAEAVPDVARVAAAYETSLAIARSQKAKSWELRTATSYARFMMERGRAGEARAMLLPVYEWFTEGFDTVDLKRAKQLLGELGRG